MQKQNELQGAPAVRASAGVFVGLAGVAAALTMVYLGMRSVMEIGGVCAEGNTPFVPVHQCPKGAALMLMGGIWMGAAFAGLYVWQSVKHHVPSFLGLLWPALFLSLGWNFLDFGLDPGNGAGLAWGWLICAVLFFLMGGLPLIAVVPWMIRSFTGTPERPRGHAGLPAPGTMRVAMSALSGLARATSTSGSATTTATAESDPATGAWSGRPPGTGADIVSQLERLDALHRSGALDDQEYEAAKVRILGRETGP